MSMTAYFRVIFALILTSWIAFPAKAMEVSLVKEGGVYTLPVMINGIITLHFILDSGAAEVVIPAEVALTLLRSGTVQENDFLPGRTYTLADGSHMKSPRFVIRSMEVGKHKITNIPAAVGPVGSALLLGQSLLEKLGTWSLDSRRQVLVLKDPEEPRAKPIRKTEPVPVSLEEAEHGSLPEDWVLLRKQAAHFIEAGEYGKAEPYLEKALKVQEETLGVKHLSIPETASMLIHVYEKQNKQKEADSLNTWADSVWGQ